MQTTAATYTVKVNATTDIGILGEASATFRVMSLPVINANYTVPTYPRYNRNVALVANVTDQDNTVVYVNFTLTAPNGSIINLTNGSRAGDLYNASFNLTSYGTWKWNVSAYDSDGFIVNSSSTGQIILMQVTENLNVSVALAASPVAIAGHINLSNGTSVSNNPINIYLNDNLLGTADLTNGNPSGSNYAIASLTIGSLGYDNLTGGGYVLEPVLGKAEPVGNYSNNGYTLELGYVQTLNVSTNTTTDSFGNYNYTFTTPLTAGTYLIKVNTTTSDGISGEALQTLSIETNSRPNVPIFNGPPNGSYFSTINITILNITLSDDNNFPQTFSCTFNGDNATNNPSNIINVTGYTSTNGSIFTYNWTGLNDSTYFWKSQCEDGLAYSDNLTANFTIDTTNPQVSFTFPTEDNNTYFNRNYVFANASVAENNFANITFYLYDSTSLINETNFTTQTFSINFSNLNSNKLYYYNITARDKANNINSTETRNITLDSTSPQISFAFPTENNATFFNRNFIFVNVSVTEANLKNITFYLFNSTRELINDSGFTNLTTGINFTNLNSNMEYYYNVTVIDLANNSNSSDTRNMTLDTTNPQINFTATLSNGTFIDQNYITINLTLNEINLANITYYLYNGSADSVTLYNETNFTAGTLFINFTNIDSREKSYLINVTARDKAGNINSTETRNITLDNVFPQINFTAPTPDNNSRAIGNSHVINTSIRDISVKSCILQVYNGTDNATNYTMEVRGNNCNITISTIDGYNYTLKAYVNDSALHENSTGNWSFRENSKPEIPDLIGPANNSRLLATSVILNYTTTDNESDALDYAVYFGTSPNPTTQVYFGSSKTFIVSAARGTTYYWKVQADDNYENSSNSTIRQFTINTQPPSPLIITPNLTGIKLRGGQIYNISWVNSSDAENDNTTITLYYSSDSGITYPNLIASGLNNNGTYDWAAPSINSNTVKIKSIANDSYEFTQDESDNDFIIDSNAPAISLDNPPNVSVFNNGTFINLTITDNLAGVSNVSWNNGSLDAPNRTDFNGTFDINTTGWGVGDVNITVYANDSVGNSVSAYFRFTVTGVQPVVTFNKPSPNQAIRGTFRINASATAQLDDAAFVNFTYNGAAQNYTMTQAGANYFYDFDTTAVTDGSRLLSVYGNDSAGNNVKADILAIIDNTNPAARLDNPLNNSWKNGSVAFAYTPNDLTNILNCSLMINGTINQSNSSISKGITNLFSNVNLGNGVYSWDVNCTDAAGNNGANETALAIKADTIKPIITLLDPVNESHIQANYSISFSVTDALSGVYNVSWSSDYALDSMEFTGSYAINTSEFPEGPVNITITANDSAGNKETLKLMYVIDNTAPLVTFNKPSALQVVRGIFRVNITGTDQLSTVANVTFAYNGSQNFVMSRATLPTFDYFYDWNTTNTSDKQYIISIYGNDTAIPPNVKFVSRYAIADNTPPAVRLDGPGNDTWSSTALNTFEFAPSELNNLNNCTLLINGSINATLASPVKNATNSFSVNLSDGNYRWTVNCSDGAVDTNGVHNMGTNESEYLISVDTANPQIDFVSPATEANDTYFARNYTAINITINEANFGNVTFYLYNQTSLINETNFTSAAYFINFTGLSSDLYFYNVTVRDKSNRQNSTETRQISLNARPPSSKKFAITNSLGTAVASIDDKGDMYLLGNMTRNIASAISPTPGSFIIQNRTGDAIAYINSTGFIFLKGTLVEDAGITLSGTNFEIRDSPDRVVAVIDSQGNLKLTGLLAENYNDP